MFPLGSIDRALCPGIGDKREEKIIMPSRVQIHNSQENVNNNNSPDDDWDSKSYGKFV